MSSQAVSYELNIDVPPGYYGKLVEFIYKRYLVPQSENVKDIQKDSSNKNPSISFTISHPTKNATVRAEVTADDNVHVKLTPLGKMGLVDYVERIKEDIDIIADYFEENIRAHTLFFAWREGETIVPEKVSEKGKGSINRLFLETQVLLFVLFIVLGAALFLTIGATLFFIIPVILLAMQFTFVFFSSKIIAKIADWQITKKNPIIHLLEYRLPLKEGYEPKQDFTRAEVSSIKQDIYEQTIAKRGEIDCESAGRVMSKYGIACDKENMTTKKINVYELVKKAADIFHFPMPQIVVSNTMIPNAAASGPSPSRGIVLMTTGLFVELSEDQIFSVLGHEFGHLQKRDPIWLFALTSLQFLITFYVVFPFFPFIFTSLLFIVYFWAVTTIIYFIAKFFEARADLTSAIVVGEPNVLADSLEKIGFKRLLQERVPFFRIQEWISLDPHPPIYFRVKRLKDLRPPVRIKHTLYQSAKEVTRGFIDSL